jgi:hypothetical protein
LIGWSNSSCLALLRSACRSTLQHPAWLRSISSVYSFKRNYEALLQFLTSEDSIRYWDMKYLLFNNFILNMILWDIKVIIYIYYEISQKYLNSENFILKRVKFQCMWAWVGWIFYVIIFPLWCSFYYTYIS